jgi:rhodanese-related sulfurtransferase
MVYMTEAVRTAALMVAEARVRVESLSPDAVARELLAGDALLIDLRESEERIRDGVIPGALHIPRGLLEFQADSTGPQFRRELQPSRRIIVHCGVGNRSALAADLLQSMGYHNVAHLDGGFRAWSTAGHSVLQG